MALRPDMAGMFWDDTPPPKPPPKEKIKRTPPEPVWLRPDYLPGLEEALAFNVDHFSDQELVAAAVTKERLVYDIECYPNYFLIAFQSLASGKVVDFELRPGGQLDVAKLRWIMENFLTIGFNSWDYDVPLTALAIAGKSCSQLFSATERIILQGERSGNVLRSFKVKKLNIDHIDLIEVAPLRASLKIYAGRLHTRRMQDLPFVPGTILSPEQQAIVRWYCVNDLNSTALLYNELKEPIALREAMSREYDVDLRSKSDAQVAEAVIAHEIWKLNGHRPQRPQIEPGTAFKYNIPSFIQYTSPTMQWVLDRVRQTWFYVGADGAVGMPQELADLKIPIAQGVYRMGIGGLHSSESAVVRRAGPGVELRDVDVESYYPAIILNQGLFPQHLGTAFLQVYGQLVARRLTAKHTGDKATASSLKITINGSFGKLGSPYSVLYSPHLLIQVTLTGQLALLMLIERFELAGFIVLSANTDGVVIQCPTARKDEFEAIVKGWEEQTRFKTEETKYKMVLSRDVNNYIAIKEKGGDEKARFLDERLGCKTKGAYCERGSAGNSVLSKNPTALVSSDAVITFLTNGTPIHQTVRACTDIRRFICVRSVTGGAVKNGVFLGKSIRWYYATSDKEGEIIYAKNGNKVPRSEGAKPLMVLPDEFPDDVNYEWYEVEAEKILKELGYYQD